MRLAAKLLAEVEVSAESSHQHEFNAGVLRAALEFGEEPIEGTLELAYLGRGGSEPQFETCAYKLYDSRKGKPRSAEYRLYYGATELQANAQAGDILIISRPDDRTDLKAIILPRETDLGRTIEAALAAEGIELKEKFGQISGVIAASEVFHLLEAASELGERIEDDGLLQLADTALIEQAIASRRLPPTRQMASEGWRMAGRYLGVTSDPDLELFWGLEAETVLFRHIEGRIGQQALDALASGGSVPFDAATALIMSLFQSRKSRRGQSLQNHFSMLLERRRIPYDAQCETEGGETPDFIFPGCSQYGDQKFPAERLRAVACKSSVKERWGQILKEARRVPDKFLLTVDPELTDDVISRMIAKSITIFVPSLTVARHYESELAKGALLNITTLVDRVSNL